MSDRRIHQIESLIDSGAYELLSFDLFDTVIWRMVPAPRDVFFLVGRELIRRGLVHPSSTPESFHKERTGAEERARRKRATPEVTLAEIYTEFPRGYLNGTDPAEVARIEFETERSVVRINPDMAALIERARAKGMKLAFVSDTYFGVDEINALVPIPVDHLLLSSVHRVSKYQGLHRFLIDASGIASDRILHVGNDRVADVEGPSLFGIATFEFTLWPEPFEDPTVLELPTTLSRRGEVMSAPDGGLTTLRSRAMNRVDGMPAQWGAGVLGPIVTGFAEWVSGRCRDLGIDTVLCLMREGRVLKGTIDIADGTLSTSEFYVSRYIARRAAIFSATAPELAKFLHRPSPQPLGRLLDQLGLSADDLDADPDERLAPKEIEKLAQRLARDGKLRRRIEGESARLRANLLAHLKSVLGGSIPPKVAIVDLGYKGTIQECLQRIFDGEKIATTTHGLYLVTGGDVHETQSTGAAVEGWLAENGQPIAMAHTFMRSPEIVEQSLMAPCGTTLGHADDGTPILDDVRIPEGQRAAIEQIQQGILTFARLRKQGGTRDGGMTPKELLRAIAIRAVARPLAEEVECFGEWEHDENFGSTETRRLAEIRGLDPWEATHMSAHQLASLPMSAVYWPFGFAQRLSPALGEAVAGIYLRAVEPEAFDAPHAPQYLAAYWDTGRGFHAGEASLRPFRVSNRGTVWQRFTLDLTGGEPVPRRLGFSIGLKDQIIRLAGIRLRSKNGDGAGEVRLEHDALEAHGYRHLGHGLYLVELDPALLVVPGELIEQSAERVDIDLFFGLVPEAA